MEQCADLTTACSRFRAAVRRAAVLLLAPGLLGLPGVAVEAADSDYHGCLQFVRNLRTTPSCLGLPDYDKFFALRKMHWTNGTPYLVVHTGNDLELYNITTPLNPNLTTGSNFRVQNLGDSDYDLLNFSLCDGCRYGIANFKLKTVLFDLGTATAPLFGASRQYDVSTTAPTIGFTFRHGGQQYVMGSGLGGSCATGTPVMLVTGVSSVTQAGCVPSLAVQNGFPLSAGGTNYLALANSSSIMYIYQVGGSGTALTFSRVGPELKAWLGGFVSAAVDQHQQAVMATGSAVDLYDLANPPSPVLLRHLPVSSANLGAVGGSLLLHAATYAPGSETLYDIDDFRDSATPQPIAPDFWSDAYSWNQHECDMPTGAVLSDDGTGLYTANFGVLKVIDATACGDPVAAVGLDKTSYFPGETVSVTNASTGIYDQCRVWITNETGAFVAGDTGLVACEPYPRRTITYRIPSALPATRAYTAHVEIPTDEGPDYDARAIGIDRAPQVTSITYSPNTPLTGDSVTFTATAEYPPASWTWDIVSPSHAHTTNPTNVLLNQSGTWTVTATAHYLHYTPTGVLYTASKTISFDISSVFAAFTVPTAPLNTEVITLDASSTVASPGATLSYDWSLTGPTGYTCPHTVQCTIPADTLSPGVYTVGLTVRNTGNGDASTATPKTMDVADGVLYLDFSWSPGSPQIGQLVLFNVTGVPAGMTIQAAQWNFGGPGCSPYVQSYTCTPGYSDCTTTSYKYLSGGTKYVSLTVTIDGKQFTATPHAVDVQYSGSCSGCAYSLSPGTRVLPATAGSSTVDVDTGATCTWDIATTSPWVTFTSPTSGTGPATVDYQVAANPAADRVGTLAAEGALQVVHQEGAYTPGDCSQAGPHDDGTVENGYGWSAADTLVEKFTPPAYPTLYTDVCVGWTRSTGDTSVDYDVVFLDDNGPGGGPGTLLATVPAHGSSIPSWLGSVLVPTQVAGASPLISDGGVWVGVSWNDAVDMGFYVPADESAATPLQQGRFRQDGGSWLTLPSAYPSYRALFIRPVAGAGPPGSPWELVVGGLAGGGNGFGDPGNAALSAAAAFDGRLYAGTASSSISPAELWGSDDGAHWAQAAPAGFGDSAVSAISALALFGGRLYAGTSRTGGARIWRSADGAAWAPVSSAGFGDAGNGVVQALAVFNGYLYAATGNTSGCELWRSSDGSSWSQVGSSGFGIPVNLNALALQEFDGRLYAATDFGVWRSSDGSSWTQVLSHAYVSSLEEFGGQLYAGMTGGAVWRSADGGSWSEVMAGGFGDPDSSDIPQLLATGDYLYAALSNGTGGAEVWRTADGTGWAQASWGGFGDPGNEEVRSLGLFQGDLYAGTVNPAGLEMWRLRGGDDALILFDGFESAATAAWTSTTGPVTATAAAAHTGDWGLEVGVGFSCTSEDDTVLSHQTVTGTVDVEACSSIAARDGYTIATGGHATLRAGRTIALGNGFSVLGGGSLAAALDLSLTGPYAFVQDTSPASQTTYRAELWTNLDGLGMGGADQLVHLVAANASGNETLRLVITGGGQITLQVRDNAGTRHSTAAVPLGAGWNHVVLSWEAATAATASLAVNDGTPAVVAGIDTSSRRVDTVRWGLVGGTLTSTSGVIRMDDFSSWR